jgi:hypothetical protein
MIVDFSLNCVYTRTRSCYKWYDVDIIVYLMYKE